jgi:hypothetical protein
MISEMIPTQCDASSWVKGKKNPVTLVRTVVTRKMPVQPSIRTPAMSPPKTTSPAAMATILMTVWTRVRGFVSYAVLKGVSGRGRQVSWLGYLLAGLFVLRFALG